MNTIKTVIVEDQLPTQNFIGNILTDHCQGVSIVAKATTVKSAEEVILKHQPDLIISDIKLGEENSFELLESLAFQGFSSKVIFITAYEGFALPAFAFEPFGFLLKPIDPDKLVGLVRKLETRLLKKNGQVTDMAKASNKVVFKTQEGWHIVNLNEIIRCESDKGYSSIYTKNQGTITLAKKIIDIQKIIKGNQFLRVHQSHIVNLNEVQLLKKGRNTMLRLSDGSELPVSAAKKQMVFERVSHFPGV